MNSGDALSPAASAFDAVAEQFDSRFGNWLSVMAQRNAVRQAVVDIVAPGARILEIGGGTGEDALWLAERGYKILLTDASPRMVQLAERKLSAQRGVHTLVVPAESLNEVNFEQYLPRGELFDAVFSNFAALNCVTDLRPVARGLARLVRPGGSLLLVVFGSCSPGEVIVELARRRPSAAFRRFRSREAPARLGGREFSVRYHRSSDIRCAMGPWFRVVARRGVGIFVPPSAAEPWISRYPRLVNALERLDRVAQHHLATFGDHVLYHLERTHDCAAVPS